MPLMVDILIVTVQAELSEVAQQLQPLYNTRKKRKDALIRKMQQIKF